MCASIGVTRIPKVGKLPAPSRHRSPRLSQAVRASERSPPSPFLDGRKSVPSTARANKCASIGVTRIPKVGKLPAPSRHRPPILSQTARDSRHSPTAVSRWSKICPAARPRPLVCKHRCDPIPKVGKLPAPSRHRPPILSQTARDSRHSPIAVSRWSKICPTARPRPLVCKHRCDRIPEIGRMPAPSRRRPPTLSQTARDSRHSPTAVSRWSKSVAPATCAKLACMQAPV
jgi:hypothetical protein